jgi:hypothetical protein
METVAVFSADPVAIGAVIGALALVVFAAALHKLAQPDWFAGALSGYRLLPPRAVPVTARALPVAEIALGIGILLPVTRVPALFGLAALLSLYALAMAINLGRGRRDIDCGCGGAAHPLSWGLAVRNVVLAAAALMAARPMVERSMEWTDALTLVLAVLAFYGMYLMTDELLRQSTRLARMARREREQA